jgi:sestrin
MDDADKRKSESAEPNALSSSVERSDSTGALRTSKALATLPQAQLDTYSSDLFRSLAESDPELRLTALNAVLHKLNESLQTPTKDLVRLYAARIVRHATEVPFEDLRQAFSAFIEQVDKDKSSGIVFPAPILEPSSWIPKTAFEPVNTTKEPFRRIFVDMFTISGRVAHVSRVISLHPGFFDCYFSTLSFVMREPGPLQISWRWYIALLAASQYQCVQLVNRLEQDFLANGGNPDWLQGIDVVPQKLRSLMDVLQILCHQPWLLTKDHTANLLKGADSWGVAELVHAMIVICTWTAIASIVFGCGVTPEVDDAIDSSLAIARNSDRTLAKDADIENRRILELLERGYKATDDEDAFAKADTVTNVEAAQPESVQQQESSRLARYRGAWNKLTPVDFDMHSKLYSIFRVNEYSWKEHGYELCRRFLPDAATLLDEEFDYIYNLTYMSFGPQRAKVDTLPFRRAVWQYVQRIKGMFHDDYNYAEVNIFLNRETKTYIKLMACAPYRLNQAAYDALGNVLEADEKVHVALLAAESARQSALLYGLHAAVFDGRKVM